jgi:signal recognition particle subunit SRP54
MFDQLGEKLQSTFKKLTGKGKLGEKDIDDALREIKMALLEADVNYKVVKNFLASIREQALCEDVLKSLTPGQQVIKIVNAEMVKLLGKTASDIKFNASRPFAILMAGVQGSGKTTSTAKLAAYVKTKGKSVLLAACDTRRAAAVDQLKILAEEAGVAFYGEKDANPAVIAASAWAKAKKDNIDVLIVDTAGRQHVDEALMAEIADIGKAVPFDEVYFVIDCMMGQQAVDAAAAFDEAVAISGFILSKADSDARAGAALSVSFVTGKPVKFAGTGEKIKDFELFHPDRIANRILGMGDILSLIEKAEQLTDAESQKKLAKKMMANDFTLEDYLEQIDSIAKMGGLGQVIGSLPIPKAKLGNMDAGEKQLARTKAIIQSMTKKERANPAILNASRRKRIAAGSGTTVAEVNKLLNGFEQSKKMMKQFKGNKGKFSGFPFM